MLLCYYLRTMKLTNGVLFIVALWSLVLQVLQMFWRYPERREVEWNYSVMSEANKIDLLLMGWLFRSAHLGFCEGANLDERGLLYKPAIPYCGKNMKSNLIIKVQILSGVTLCRMLHVLISNLTFEPSVILRFFFFFCTELYVMLVFAQTLTYCTTLIFILRKVLYLHYDQNQNQKYWLIPKGKLCGNVVALSRIDK